LEISFVFFPILGKTALQTALRVYVSLTEYFGLRSKYSMSKVSLSQFGDRMIVLLPALMQELWLYERSFFARGEINVQQLEALNYLSSRDSCTMRQLARTMGLRESTTTGLVDRMVAMGFLKRQRDTRDRRVVRAAITAKGKAALKELRRQQRRGFISLFKRASASERSRVLEIIERLVRQMAPDKPEDSK
jgi:DNA-binding MarR family transcriptional regulator